MRVMNVYCAPVALRKLEQKRKKKVMVLWLAVAALVFAAASAQQLPL